MSDLHKTIIDLGLYEIRPFVKSLFLKRKFMLLSYESVRHAEMKLVEKMQIIKAEKDAELIQKGRASWGVEDRKKWNVDIEGFNVDILDYVGKGVWDFFHYARMSLDMLLQITNTALFYPDDRLNYESVSAKSIYAKLPEGSLVKKKLHELSNNEYYLYIQAADDYLKHIETIGIRLKTTDILEGFDSFEIKDFVYRSGKYDTREVSETIQTIKDFVIEQIEDYFRILLNESKSLKRNNQITDIKYETLVDGNTLKHISYFIDVPNSNSSLLEIFSGKDIYVHPLIVDNEYRIFDDPNFDFDTIFIRQEGTNNNIGKAHIVESDCNAFFKKYEVTPCGNNDYVDYIIHFNDNYKDRKRINMVALQGVERRIRK